MKELLILFLLVWNNCYGAEIVKRLINEHNNSTNNSFHVNVSAGYGVHSENTTLLVTPVYEFQEKRIQKDNNTQDQILEPSVNFAEVVPSPSYQVHEKSSEVQEKNFQTGKNYRLRSSEKRYRNNEARKPSEKDRSRQVPELAAGTKIVEVLRVPAMYELRLQSDPQRLVQLNTVWLNKLMSHNQYNKPVVQPTYQNFAAAKNVYQPLQQSTLNQQPQSNGFGFGQASAGYDLPNQRLGTNFQNLKTRIPTQKFNGQSLPQSNSYGINQSFYTHDLNQHKSNPRQVPRGQNLAGFKYNYLRPQNYPADGNFGKKLVLEASTPSPLNQLSNEIPSDYYQKPQALHEVPAPVLNRESHKSTIPKITATSVPSLVYGKPMDQPYQPSTQQIHQIPVVASQNQAVQNGGYHYPVPSTNLDNYHQLQLSQNVQTGNNQYATTDIVANQQQNEKLIGFGQQQREKLNGFGQQQHNSLNGFGQQQHNNLNGFGQKQHENNGFGQQQPGGLNGFEQQQHNNLNGFGQQQHEKLNGFGQQQPGDLNGFGQHDSLNGFGQQQHGKLNGLGQGIIVSHYPQSQKQNLFSQVIYQQTPQNYYNDAIGDYLDQTLSSVNGEVSAFVNNDGTMTISNFEHVPKLSQFSGDYAIPVTENAEGAGNYVDQNTDLTNFHGQENFDYNPETTAEDNQIETADNQGYSVQNNADLTKLLLPSSRSSGENATNQKYKPVSYRKKYTPREMYSKSYLNRRTEPMDYIVYIKERTFD